MLPIASATDKDGEDDELVYWLEKTSKIPFELVSFGSNQIGRHRRHAVPIDHRSLPIAALNVTEPLDRETRPFYELQLTASDRGNLTSTIPIHISISDINDNVPSFDQQQPYTANVSESTLPSLTKSLLRIHAIDNDSNENGRVTYHFSPQVSDSIRQTFQLNAETGDLFLLQSLDYEQHKEYRIQVTAQDSGPVSVPVYTVIIINVEDENDNVPTMNLRVSEYFHLVNNTLYISEATPLNTLLMHIIVQDLDSNLNGKVQCMIEPLQPKLNLTNTINNMFAVYNEEMFDRETRANYSIRLIVEDSGLKKRHRAVRELQLIITDVNDSPPIFTQAAYIISVQEEETFQRPLIQVHANDADLNENGEVSYELMTKEYNHLFKLNEQTGELFLEQKLDRETQTTYNLTIRARDHGRHPSSLFTDVLLTIDVLDKNEYAPEFEQNKYSFVDINENIPINTSLGFVRAVDRDGNSIRYTILSTDLLVNPRTGELVVGKALDYDTSPCINTLVTAHDPAGWNTSCSVEVCLAPVNEFAPELHSNSRLLYINIDNTSSIHLHANDRDRSPSSYISFQFGQASACNSTFEHLFANGTLYLNRNEPCTGIVDLPLTITDNDPYPSAKSVNHTVRLILYSSTSPLHEILAQQSPAPFSRHRFSNLSIRSLTAEMVIILILLLIFVLIVLIVCLIACLTYRRRKLAKHIYKQNQLLVKQSPSPLMNSSQQKRLTLLTSSSRTSKDRICFTEVSEMCG